MDKIKLTRKEFDDMYQIEEITEDTEVKPSDRSAAEILDKQDTTPFLTEEEEEQDSHLFEDLPNMEDI